MKTLTLRAARAKAGLTQEELAARSGVDQTTISRLEIGRRANPSLNTVMRLADALDIEPFRLRFTQSKDISTKSSDGADRSVTASHNESA